MESEKPKTQHFSCNVTREFFYFDKRSLLHYLPPKSCFWTINNNLHFLKILNISRPTEQNEKLEALKFDYNQ